MTERKKQKPSITAPNMAAIVASLNARTSGDWKTLYAELKLSEAQSSVLFEVVANAIGDLCDYHALRVDLRKYKHLKNRLTRLSGLLTRVEQEITRANDDLEVAMPRAAREAVVKMLASDEILTALGADAPVWASDSEQPSGYHEKCSLQGQTYPAREFEPFAWKFGVRLFEHSVQRLHAPILDWIKLARQGKGGKPRMVERDYLITKLAENSEAIIGKPPSGGNRFLALCNAVLGACMLNTEGLRDAVERTLRARKVKNGEGLARPKARKKDLLAP